MNSTSTFHALWITCVVLCHSPIHALGDPPAEPTTPVHFWDEIPASPSTTMPQSIEDGYWNGQFQRVNREADQADGAELVLFGDSITWHWSLGNRTGQDVWNEEFSPYRPINMGNSGDITPVMLYRCAHGNLDFAEGQQPKVAVLLCGTNNFVVTQSAGGKVQWELGRDCPPADVANGARAVAQLFRRRLPKTRVIMLGVLPVRNETKWGKCQQTNAMNAAVQYNENEVVFLDLKDRLLQPDGSLNEQLFTDGTHLTEQGYRVWAESITPVIEEMIAAEPLAPKRIMLIGGSVTEGANSATAYRRYLDGMLRRKGLLIDFVGSRQKHNDNRQEPDSYEFDVDHEGHWGKDSKWLAANLPNLLKGEAPDVAVVQMGAEDIASSLSTGKETEPLVNEIIENIGTAVDSLRAKNESVKIVLTETLPIRGKSEEVDLLNLKLARFANAHSTPQSLIAVADLNAVQGLACDTGMPTAEGAHTMAERLATLLHEMLNDRPE